jgi:hypothetical protein
VLAATTARATPVLHTITGGNVTIDVKYNGTTIGSATTAMIGGSVIIDADLLQLDALRLEISPTLIILSVAVWGYDQINVESAILEGDPGFNTIVAIGVPALFTAVAGPLTVTGAWSATDSSGINSPAPSTPISFPVLAMTAIVNVSPLVEIDSVTINSIDGTAFGFPGDHLTIVANYYVTSTISTPIPEPGTGLLLGLGLALLSSRRTRSSLN